MTFDQHAAYGTRAYRIAEWYLSQCYGDYNTPRHNAFVMRWNAAQERRNLQEWIARRTKGQQP